MRRAAGPNVACRSWPLTHYISCEDQVFVHNDAEREAGTFGERRLDLEIAPRELLPGLVDGVLNSLSRRDDHVSSAISIGRGELRACAEETAERRTRKD